MEHRWAVAEDRRIKPLVVIGCLLMTVIMCYFTYLFGVTVPILFVGFSFLAIMLYLFLHKPKISLFFLIAYVFLIGIFVRDSGIDLPYGMLIEGLLLIGWFITLIKSKKGDLSNIANEVTFLWGLWFLLSVLQVFNPSGASVQGWASELKPVALYPLLIIPLTFLLFKTNKDLNVFLIVIIGCSVLGALNGIKQEHWRLSPGEAEFLATGGDVTHLLWGKLRVFSFYSDAGQFGASQAHIGLVALTLAFGPFKRWKRISLLVAAGLMFYGMMISGTRGALFAFLVGALFMIILNKKFKILFFGAIALVLFVGFLKFTHIGNSNYHIYRLRTALDPKDASLNVRFDTQAFVRNYLKDKPFGDGLGVLGANGNKYNSDKAVSKIQPDSYFVKLWVMCGIVGLTIWLCITVYILGKCCGIVWGIKDKGLQTKLIALTSGYAGVLFCSYGNEVINAIPSSIVVYASWVFVLIGPKLQEEITNSKKLTT